MHVDAQDRVFQCRLDTDLNVQFATALYQTGGTVEWSPAREEYDKVATLPTICEHYRQLAFEE